MSKRVEIPNSVIKDVSDAEIGDHILVWEKDKWVEYSIVSTTRRGFKSIVINMEAVDASKGKPGVDLKVGLKDIIWNKDYRVVPESTERYQKMIAYR